MYHALFNVLKLLIIDSYNPTKVQPSIQSIKIGTLQHAPGNPKKVCRSVCKCLQVTKCLPTWQKILPDDPKSVASYVEEHF